MRGKVLILDTSVLCCWLKVPGKDTAGSRHDLWDFQRIDGEIKRTDRGHRTFILPLAAIIETGNHISQARGHNIYEIATKFAQCLRDCAEATVPWAAVTEQAELWDSEKLKDLSNKWPDLAIRGVSLGDATIIDIAEYYANAGCSVEILTGDAGLKAYEPVHPLSIPRRRS